MEKLDAAEAMELENSMSAEDAATSNHANHTETVEGSPVENKGKLTTVASTYFDEKIPVPKVGGVCIKISLVVLFWSLYINFCSCPSAMKIF